ncbi:polyamine ABC transporter substrate-binding protein [Pyrobaculum neutrophilum]|uniref:Extracellular solute-binding protein family 1 n=1 Tax=Pyrobaculum neutrophilum (strain DSM 2338 / JCM 9278 / NBRC 100436 / V24Sta) TaxID=444157 RepID=B1YAL7_PYRNV|nr:spermidine/putrescine ABC transporter substrate-binding protein [Pyrobaculum neutrophilum]ACB39096.1 extracellular solute-binding protein family 1 [Pyrobaculum neutrophilum V24Sta]
MVTRRKLLAGAVAAAVVAALGGSVLLSRGPEKRAATLGGQLAVYNYSYYIDKDLLTEFERETGVKVIYQEFESGEEAYAALLRGGGGYDLVVVPDMYLKEVIKGGYVRKMDHGRLANINNIDQAFFDNPNDPGLQHSIPYAFGTTGFAVNYHAMAVEAGRKLESWGDLFDFGLLEKMRNKVAMLEEFVEPVMAAKYALGIDPNDWSQAAVDKVAELLKKQKGYIRGYMGVSQIVPAIAAGELWVSQIWSGDAATARDEFIKHAGEKNADKFEYVLPKPMTHRWVDFMVIPRDAKNIDAAYAFIDFLLRPENSARITKASYYPTALKRQLLEKHLSPDILQDPTVFPPEGAKLIYLNYTDEMIKAVEKISYAVKG